MSAVDGRVRVLLACDFFVRYTSMLAGGLAATGAEVALLTRDHDLEFGGREGAAARFVRGAVGGDFSHHRIGGRVRSPRGLAQARAVRRALREFAPDVVHVQSSIGNDMRLLYAAGVRPRRFALTMHDPVQHPGDSVARMAAASNRLLVRAAGLIFVHSDALREQLVEVAAPRAPVVVVPHGVDAAAPRPLPNAPRLLFFGRLSHYKGIDVLLDALPRLWRSVPDATLTIAGDGPLPDHPGLADDRVIVRAEHVPDEEVPELIADATCVALPYRQASQSGVGSLVKAHGRPLVVTSVGGLPELVADGSGLLVDSEDADALADALADVLRDRALAERLAAAGVATAERQGGWDGVARLTLAAYRDHLPPRRKA